MLLRNQTADGDRQILMGGIGDLRLPRISYDGGGESIELEGYPVAGRIDALSRARNSAVRG